MTVTPRNTIRTFALVCVCITSAFLIFMGVWLTILLSTDGWCDRAVGASKDAAGVERPEYSVGGCFQLLNAQVEALAWNSHIVLAVMALCLLVLMVIVVSGGHLSFSASKAGLSGNLGGGDGVPETPAEGAKLAAGAATDVAKKLGESEAD